MTGEIPLHPEFEPTDGLALLMRADIQELIQDTNARLQYKDVECLDEDRKKLLQRLRRRVDEAIGVHHIDEKVSISGFGREIIPREWTLADDYQAFDKSALVFAGTGILIDGDRFTTVMNFRTLDEQPQYFAFMPHPSHIEALTIMNETVPSKSQSIELSTQVARIHYFAKSSLKYRAEGNANHAESRRSQIDWELYRFYDIEDADLVTCSTTEYTVLDDTGNLIFEAADLPTPEQLTGIKMPDDGTQRPSLTLLDNGGWSYLIPYTELKAIAKNDTQGQEAA